MDLEDLYRLLRAGHVQAQGIVDTLVEPLRVLDTSLCVPSGGFGSQLIDFAMKQDLAGTAELHFEQGGFRGAFCVPIG